MKKTISISTLLIVILLVSGCGTNSVKNIKADYIDIALGQNLYSGNNKVDQETVQSLVDAYNNIEYIGETNQQINFDNAITITFIHNDQISGTLMIDNKGIFHHSRSVEIYQIEPNNNLYEEAIEVYNNLKQEYSNI